MDKNWFVRNHLASQNARLEPLKLALDKLSFANNGYQERAIKTCLWEEHEEEISYRVRTILYRIY